MINEGLMAVGDWSCELLDTTPDYIRDLFNQPGTNFIVTPTRIDDESITLTALVALALYNGIIRRRNIRRGHYGGPGMLGFIQTNRGYSGNAANAPSPFTNKTFTQVAQAWFAASQYDNGINFGTDYGATATQVKAPANYTYYPPVKSKLDEHAKQTGNEYRINPDGTVDVDTAATGSTMFTTSPTVLLSPDIPGGVEGSYRALDVDMRTWSVDEDLDDYRNVGQTIDSARAATGLASAASPVNMLRWGSLVQNCRFSSEFVTVDSSNTTDLGNVAQSLADEFSGWRRRFTCNVSTYAPTQYVNPGDYVYVYDPKSKVQDTSNQIEFGGGTIFPEKIRCVGVQWPLLAPMGFFTYYNNVVTNVTDWIKPERGLAKLTLDNLPRQVDHLARQPRPVTR